MCINTSLYMYILFCILSTYCLLLDFGSEQQIVICLYWYIFTLIYIHNLETKYIKMELERNKDIFNNQNDQKIVFQVILPIEYPKDN